MVNVEADALAGPAARAARARSGRRLLARVWRPAGADLRDGRLVPRRGLRGRRRRQGHEIPARVSRVDAGHGLAATTASRRRQVAAGDFNAQMFNSFLDGTKSAIEMAAVANATGLTPAPDGLAFPPCGVDDLPRVLRPRAEGGRLHHAGQVEVISSVERDGRPVFRDLRWGVYVTFRAGDAASEDYVRRCFRRIRLLDRSRRAAMRRCTSRITRSGSSSASASRRSDCAREPTGARDRVARRRRRDGQSAISRPAKRSTAKAVTPCTASCCPPRASLKLGAACRSGSRTASR